MLSFREKSKWVPAFAGMTKMQGSTTRRLLVRVTEVRLRDVHLEPGIDLDAVDRVVAQVDQGHDRADVAGLLAGADRHQVVVGEGQAGQAAGEEVVLLLRGGLGHRVHSMPGFERGSTRCTT